MDHYQRVLGSFYGAALGDAMGAATETMTPQMIRERFGQYLNDLVAPGPGTFAEGCPVGFVTDDFSLAYFTARALLDCRGTVTPAVAEAALIEWAEHPEYFRFAGPSTRRALQRIMGEETVAPPFVLACDNSGASNGSAMKIFPAGLIHPGDPDSAVKTAVTLCAPTHYNTSSLSAAGAIAAAVSVAVTGASLRDVLDAGFYGARLGSRYGAPVAVASVERRMELAVSIAERGLSWEETMLELAAVIGSGLSANEAVPCVFGILAATGGDVMSSIKMGVNIGNDTDTIATMAGAIAGAMCGADAIPMQWANLICQVNQMDLPVLARNFTEVFFA